MPLAIEFPSWLKPEIIPGLPIRWYGLMYVVAFGVAFLLYRRQVKERNFPMSDDQLSGLFCWGILALILGARIFYAIVYEQGNRYPWLVFWPFRDGKFVGLSGMSYHGGVIGGVLAMVLYSWRKKFDFRELGDMFAASIPLGYTFGRLGNFINGELYGRITDSPLGIIFPGSGICETSKNFEVIKKAADEMGIAAKQQLHFITNNHHHVDWLFPRHPSQLYEAFFEGIFLWAVIWLLRNRKPFKGFLITLYISGYGLVRFFIEYFREPDSSMGYPLDFVKSNIPAAISHPMLSFSTGQLLCIGMILLGIAWAFVAYRIPHREPIRIYSQDNMATASSLKQSAEKAARKKQRKKIRDKLK